MNLSKLNKKELFQLKGEIENEIKNRNKDYVLKLKVDKEGDLLIYFVENNLIIKLVGWIDKNGKTGILYTKDQCECYEKWREHGMKIDNSIIRWLGGKYQLIETSMRNIPLRRTDIFIFLKRIDIFNGDIYNFNKCETVPYCEDTNILRFKHNLRPY